MLTITRNIVAEMLLVTIGRQLQTAYAAVVLIVWWCHTVHRLHCQSNCLAHDEYKIALLSQYCKYCGQCNYHTPAYCH
jgi:hypothetical protein